MVEMLPQYEGKINKLRTSSQDLMKNSKNKTESDKFLNDITALQDDFGVLKQSVESSKSK